MNIVYLPSNTTRERNAPRSLWQISLLVSIFGWFGKF